MFAAMVRRATVSLRVFELARPSTLLRAFDEGRARGESFQPTVRLLCDAQRDVGGTCAYALAHALACVRVDELLRDAAAAACAVRVPPGAHPSWTAEDLVQYGVSRPLTWQDIGWYLQFSEDGRQLLEVDAPAEWGQPSCSSSPSSSPPPLPEWLLAPCPFDDRERGVFWGSFYPAWQALHK